MTREARRDRAIRYLARAKKMRDEAEALHDDEAKRLMLQVAANYEALAALLQRNISS